jgi:hypothetical protein
VLGGYVGQYTGPWENIKIDFKRCGENEKKDPLFSVLEIGWEALSPECRSLFLDIVQFQESYFRYNVEEVLKWYCPIFVVEEAEVREWVSPYLQLDVFFIWLFKLESFHHNMKSCAL